MSSSSPLDHPRLQAVARELDAGNLDAAQHLLADIGDVEGLTYGTIFLAIRLLFLRGRLDADALALRLRDLIRDAGSFPEAERMLSSAESGRVEGVPAPAVTPEAQGMGPADAAPEPESLGPIVSDAPPLEVSEAYELLDAKDVESVNPAAPPSLPEQLRARTRPTPVDRPSGPIAGGRRQSPSAPRSPAGVQGRPDPEAVSRPSPLHLSFRELENDEKPNFDPDLSKPRHPAAMAAAAKSGKLDALIAIDELWAEPSGREPSPERVKIGSSSKHLLLEIPPAPAVPRITPPPDLAPSYVPPHPKGEGRSSKSESERPRLSERVRAEIVSDGRYSVRTTAQEAVWTEPEPRSSSSSVPTDAPPDLPAARAGDKPSARIRSGRPPPQSAAPSAPLTTFELAGLLDQRHFSAALEALGTETPGEPAERALIRARALAGMERRTEALSVLDRLVENGELGPDPRAAAARVLIDLGELEQALDQARLACAGPSESPLTRLTRAWAAVRLSRRSGRDELLLEAQRALSGLKGPTSAHSGLLLSLRACVEAQVGDAERSLGIAERALALDADAPDALAAAALASARLGRTLDAQQASLRLVDVAHEEAAALSLLFDRMGIVLTDTAPTVDTAAVPPPWDANELAWLDGRHESVVQAFERICRHRLGELAEASDEPSFAIIGAAASQALTTSPIWLNFAPYDFSLHSLERVRCALDLLYGKLARPRPVSDDFPVEVLVGAYVGETLCRAYGARWEGSVADPDSVRVVRQGGAWRPLGTLRAQLGGEAKVEFVLPVDWRLIHPRVEPLGRRPAVAADPPCPWDPEPWPNPADIPALGQALSHSVIASYCQRHAGASLDDSLESLAALDTYLGLVAPTRTRLDPPPRWAIRIAVLCGAYLGEVLRKSLAGRWMVPHDGVLNADSYSLRIDTAETSPIATVLSRVTGRSSTPLGEHAAKLLSRKG